MPRLLVVPAFGVICFFVATRWPLHRYVLLLYLLASMVAIVAYGLDKSAAKHGRWRTPESTLHVIALIGGWPGALLAQQLLRHKTTKPSFVAAFWFTVAANIAAFVAWHALAGR